MKNYPKDRYKIVVHQNPKYFTTEILAISSFAGKSIVGKAICRATDEYDEEKGKELAIARCAEKIARKRQERALKKYDEASIERNKANNYFNKMCVYLTDASEELRNAKDNVDWALRQMQGGN